MIDWHEIAAMCEPREPRNLAFAGRLMPEIDLARDRVVYPPYVRPKYLGRRPTLTQEIVDEICEQAARGARPVASAMSLGIARSTFYDWLREFPDFQTAIDGAQSLAENQAAFAVAKQDPKFWLSQGPAKTAWGKHDVVEHESGPSALPAGSVRLEAVLSVDELKHLLQMRQKVDKAVLGEVVDVTLKALPEVTDA